MIRAFYAFARPINGDAPPTEFLIFSSGVNESSKGPAVFDAQDAQEVMSCYQREGVDVMIDLEHEAVMSGPAVRPDMRDARGWCQLELRADGSLWAVNVRWTPDGARRLAEKTQRYISPCFFTDEAGHVKQLLNVALVAMPATYDAAPLVAAARIARDTEGATSKTRKLAKGNTVDPEQLKAAIDAFSSGALAKALGLDSGASPKDILAAVEAAAKALGVDQAEDSAPDDAAPATADTPAANADGVMAASALRKAFASAGTMTEAVDMLGAVVTRLSKLDADEKAIELRQRQDLVGELVKLGAETPATAWEGEPTDRKPVARLARESIADLKGRVAQLRAAKPVVPRVEPPESPSTDAAEFTDREVQAMSKMTDAQKERFKSLRASRRRA